MYSLLEGTLPGVKIYCEPRQDKLSRTQLQLQRIMHHASSRERVSGYRDFTATDAGCTGSIEQA